MGIGFHFDDIERSVFGLDADEDKPIGGFHDDFELDIDDYAPIGGFHDDTPHNESN